MFTLVNVVAGSHLYGLNHKDSDQDSMGIGINSIAESVCLHPLDQDGDNDHVIYELRKWVRLAAKGNPTILQMLFVQPEDWLLWSSEWPEIQQQLKPLVLSQSCRPAFHGYMVQQRQKMLNDRGQRQALKDQHGFDTKFAMHAIRLGLQGLEVLQTGKMTLPMTESAKQHCIDVRHGKWQEKHVLDMMRDLEEQLLRCASRLPERPDMAAIDQWLGETYKEFWR